MINEASFRSPKVGEWTDGDGLMLIVRPAARPGDKPRKTWILRTTVDGRRRKIGLGSCGLAEARTRAAEARQQIAEGKDPSRRVRARQRAAEAVSDAVRMMTFGEAAERWLPKAPKLKNAKSELIRERSLKHLAPIHAKALTSIAPADLAEILHTLKPETAIRVYGVAKAVFAFGAVLIEPEGVILRSPADLVRLRALGWSPRSRQSHKPMAALPWTRAPELLAELERDDEPIARLVRFILATASRCGAARLARRKQIDLKAKTWTIPIEDLKDSAHRREAFIVPLNDVALAAIPPGSGEYVFFNDRGRPFTDRDITYLTRKLRRRQPDWIDPATGRGFTAHGCRSMFRSWAAARREPRDVVEIAMGHRATAYGQIESAYQRDSLLELRAELMRRWGRHCRGETAVVLPMRRA
jgi:integrase